MDLKTPISAIGIALGVNVLNTLVGYFVSRYAFSKDLNVFLAIVFGSLGIRSVVVMVLAWYCLSVVQMHQIGFSITFAISSFVLLIGEILFFHRSYEIAKRQVRRPVTDLLKKKIVNVFYGSQLSFPTRAPLLQHL